MLERTPTIYSGCCAHAILKAISGTKRPSSGTMICEGEGRGSKGKHSSQQTATNRRACDETIETSTYPKENAFGGKLSRSNRKQAQASALNAPSFHPRELLTSGGARTKTLAQ